MLKNVLSGKQCASCRICCSFVKKDAWEAPIFTETEMEKILKAGIRGDRFQAFMDEDGNTVYRAVYEFQSEKEILLCPCLDEKTGCLLGEQKPFACKIWPLRICQEDGQLVLGIADCCPAFAGDKKGALLSELDERGLREQILAKGQDTKVLKDMPQGYSRI